MSVTIFDGPIERIAFTSDALRFVVSIGDPEFARYAAPLEPLVAVRQVFREPFGDMEAMIDVDRPQGPAMVMIGRAVDGGRIARCGERWFVIDYDALVARWR